MSYRREGGWPPPDHELLEIGDDGSFTMWRTIARATQPPGPIGRFDGRLTEAELATLKRRLDALRHASDIKMAFPPDSAVETIKAADRTALLPHTGKPEEPWGGLVALVRTFLFQLADRPRAALDLRLGEAGHRLDLIHRGDSPLLLDLSDVALQAILWDQNEQGGTWQSGRLQLEAGPMEVHSGWSRQLPFSHGLTETATARITAYVELRLNDSERWLQGFLETP